MAKNKTSDKKAPIKVQFDIDGKLKQRYKKHCKNKGTSMRAELTAYIEKQLS